MLEFSAAKKNLRIMSGIEKGFWTVWFQMVFLVFLFLNLSVSSLVKVSSVKGVSFSYRHVWRLPRTPIGL